MEFFTDDVAVLTARRLFVAEWACRQRTAMGVPWEALCEFQVFPRDSPFGLNLHLEF